ncbi:unnamed protein product [Protopolystoma xenopodis]|uniref:Uncharacterized protein n=1 Tax=Protopolystoma xenopodis TaxID=117903 RepID=A0A448WX64_9PLAT|nr:unnamed protein product [Protopolystoma xenopodis]
MADEIVVQHMTQQLVAGTGSSFCYPDSLDPAGIVRDDAGEQSRESERFITQTSGGHDRLFSARTFLKRRPTSERLKVNCYILHLFLSLLLLGHVTHFSCILRRLFIFLVYQI